MTGNEISFGSDAFTGGDFPAETSGDAFGFDPSNVDAPTPNERLFGTTSTLALSPGLPAPGAEGTRNLQYSIADTEERTGLTNPGPIPLDSRFSTVPDASFVGPRQSAPQDANGYVFREIGDGADSFEPLVDFDERGVKDRTPERADQTIQNSTFFHGENDNPTGAIVVDGEFATNPSGEELSGSVSGINRGGIAQLSDGRIVINTSFGSSLDAIDARYAGGDPNVSVVDFVGGSAQIIGAPSRVGLGDSTLGGGQNFTGGIDAAQFSRADHSLVGIRDGQAYAIGAQGKTGREMRDELEALGFTSVVKLDGGGTSYYNTGDAAAEISGRPERDERHPYGISTLDD